MRSGHHVGGGEGASSLGYSCLSLPHVSEEADSTPQKMKRVAQPSHSLLRDGHMTCANEIKLGSQTFVGGILFLYGDKQENVCS